MKKVTEFWTMSKRLDCANIPRYEVINRCLTLKCARSGMCGGKGYDIWKVVQVQKAKRIKK
jgi:hypothetical protein